MDHLSLALQAWPMIVPQRDFVHHLGKVKESYDRKIAAQLLPEENVYIDCRQAFKFVDLEADNPCRIEVKFRRLYLDARGGVKLQIGLSLHIHRFVPFETVEDALEHLLSKQVRVNIPGSRPKQLRLAHLAASFKHLFVHATQVGISASETRQWVFPAQPLVITDLGQLAVSHFFPDWQAHPEQDMPIKSGVLSTAQRDFPYFFYAGTTNPTHWRLNRYLLSRVASQVENLGALLYFAKIEDYFPPAAVESLATLKYLLDSRQVPQHLVNMHQVYTQQIHPRLETLQAEFSLVDQVTGSAQAPPKVGSVVQYVMHDELDQAFGLLEKLCQELEGDDRIFLVSLVSRYHYWKRSRQAGELSQEELWITRNRIVSQVLGFCEGK